MNLHRDRRTPPARDRVAVASLDGVIARPRDRRTRAWSEQLGSRGPAEPKDQPTALAHMEEAGQERNDRVRAMPRRDVIDPDLNGRERLEVATTREAHPVVLEHDLGSVQLAGRRSSLAGTRTYKRAKAESENDEANNPQAHRPTARRAMRRPSAVHPAIRTHRGSDGEPKSPTRGPWPALLIRLRGPHQEAPVALLDLLAATARAVTVAPGVAQRDGDRL